MVFVVRESRESPRCISLVVSLGFLAILKSSFVIVTLCGWRKKKAVCISAAIALEKG